MASKTVIEATVPSGFELVSLDEIAEKLPGISDSFQTRGHIRFQLPNDIPSAEQIRLLKALRSVDNLYVVVGTTEADFASKHDMKSGLIPIMEGIVNIDWQRGIEFWREFTGFREDCLKNVEGKQLLGVWNDLLASLDELVAKVEKEKEKTGGTSDANKKEESGAKKRKEEVIDGTAKKEFSFRVSSTRSGDCHPFTSREIASEVGGLLHDGFGWHVDLTKFDMEVFVIVRNNLISYCLSLTHQSLHHRNEMQRLGHMTLRSTISYNMLRLCGIQMGDIVVDPMCGSGAIVVESMLSEFGGLAFHIAGDFSESVVESKAQPSVESAAQTNKNRLGGDCLALNVIHMPFRTASIDAIIADLPFGKRCGNKQVNRWLYPAALKEFARVLKPSTGRACLMTTDAKNMNNAIWQRVNQGQVVAAQQEEPQTSSNYWVRPYRSFTVHHGGLNPIVYLLKRTAHAFI